MTSLSGAGSTTWRVWSFLLPQLPPAQMLPAVLGLWPLSALPEFPVSGNLGPAGQLPSLHAVFLSLPRRMSVQPSVSVRRQLWRKCSVFQFPLALATVMPAPLPWPRWLLNAHWASLGCGPLFPDNLLRPLSRQFLPLRLRWCQLQLSCQQPHPLRPALGHPLGRLARGSSLPPRFVSGLPSPCSAVPRWIPV